MASALAGEREPVSDLRAVAARALIAGIYYPWRATEKVLGRSLGCVVHSHHLLRDVFRSFGDSWPVSVEYPNVVDGAHSLRLQLDLCQTTQLWYFRDRGRYEPALMQLLAKAMGDASCFVDVGAHFGLFAMTIAQACPGKRVVAIEPAPETVAALRRHLSLNGLDSIEVRATAIASAGAETVYYRNPLNDGGGGLEPADEYRSGERRIPVADYLGQHPEFAPTVTVRSCRLDSLIDEPCVIKIDVEGRELDVLESAEQLFAAGHVRVMVVEVWAGHLDAIVGYLDRFDIDCFRAGLDRPLRAGDVMARRILNIVCVHRRLANGQALMGMLA